MPLPFLKNRDDGASMPVETKEREHDDTYDTLDAVADDMLAAFKKGDKGALKAALSAFADHIQSQDVAQDELTMGAV